jgi:hypothetical protein
MNEAFDGQMEGMTDAYLHWFSSLGDAGLANDNPVPSSRELQDEYAVEVLDVFCGSHSYSCSHFFLMSEFSQSPVKGRLPFARVM